MKKQILKKVMSKHDNLRTPEILGFCVNTPKVGERLFFISDSLDFEGGERRIITSPIKKIEGTRILTENSVYDLKDLDS